MSLNARRARGITLVELVMTLSVVAILASAAAPAFGTLVHRGETRSARNELATALNGARLAAVSRTHDVVVCPSRDAQYCGRTVEWQHGWLVFVDADGDGERDASEEIVSLGQAQRPGVMILSSAGRMRVKYHSDGSSPGSNLTLTVCDGGVDAPSSIVINNAGRLRTGPATPAATAACDRAASQPRA